MRCRRRRRDRLLHAGRIGAHGGAHLPEGPQGQGSRPMADYLCQTVLATHLCLDSLSPTAAAALPPSVPPKRKSTENLFCGRSHLRRRLHPATTRPSRDNITDRAPARLASFGASSSSCPESHARLRAVAQHFPRLSLLAAGNCPSVPRPRQLGRRSLLQS